MTLVRRLADALCAFRTGHSRRDLDRMSRRRLRLLGERMLARRKRQAETMIYETASFRRWATTAANLLDDLLHRRHSDVATLLVEQLEIDRLMIHFRRVSARAQIGFDEGGGQHLFKRTPWPGPGDELYGKLHEGLVQQSVLHTLQHKLRMKAANWHGLLPLLRPEVAWSLLTNGKMPISALRESISAPFNSPEGAPRAIAAPEAVLLVDATSGAAVSGQPHQEAAE